jgi:hypothetical protein
VLDVLSKELVILDPTGEADIEPGRKLAPLPRDLADLTIGILENSHGRSIDLTRLPELIRDRFPDSAVVVRRKPVVTQTAPPELLDGLASTCQVVICATAQ